MKKLITSIKFLLIGIVLFVFSCQKEKIYKLSEDSKIIVYKSWMKKNGGIFKDGNLKILLEDSSIISGTLNWDKTKTYTFNGKDYVDVPFLFNKERAFLLNTNNVSSFNLVFRRSLNGEIEAAIRTARSGVDVFMDERGNKIKGSLLSYMLLNGDKSTLWVNNQDFKGFKWVKRIAASKVKSNKDSERSINCETISFTETSVNCYGGYDTQCEVYYHTSYFTYCTGGSDQEQMQNPWPDGGGGGVGNADPQPTEIEDDVNATFSVDCGSFQYIKTSVANWQEAGVNKIRLKIIWLDYFGGSITREIFVNHVVFGLPTVYGNNTTLSPGAAANLSAQVLDRVKLLTYQQFRNSPYYPDDNIVSIYFKEQLHLAMTIHGGTAGVTGSGSSSIVFKDEERSFFNPLNCN